MNIFSQSPKQNQGSLYKHQHFPSVTRSRSYYIFFFFSLNTILNPLDLTLDLLYCCRRRLRNTSTSLKHSKLLLQLVQHFRWFSLILQKSIYRSSSKSIVNTVINTGGWRWPVVSGGSIVSLNNLMSRTNYGAFEWEVKLLIWVKKHFNTSGNLTGNL